MYRVITYRSRPLKVSTFSIDDDAATDSSVAAFDEENIESVENKSKKKQKDEKTYIIDGVEVSEEDLTIDEKLDLEANAILNADGFYNPLLPLDYFEEEEENKPQKASPLMIVAVVAVTVLLLAGVAAAMILLR